MQPRPIWPEFKSQNLYLCIAFRRQTIPPISGNMQQTHLSRIWFLSQECRPVPQEIINGKILWCHPEGYFLNAQGQKLCHCFNPAKQAGARDARGKKIGSRYPEMRHFRNMKCHLLMALTFYGYRPYFISPKTGLAYNGICHHLIPDKLDYRPANLLCWLTREQHSEADRRQRLIKKAVGIEGMRKIGYTQLRFYQDPRETSAVVFEIWLNILRRTDYVLR